MCRSSSVALSSVAGLLLYAGAPRGRRWGLYLLPMAAGCLFKTTAVMFAPILLVYLWLFEEKTPGRALRRSLPALAAAAAARALTPWRATRFT